MHRLSTTRLPSARDVLTPDALAMVQTIARTGSFAAAAERFRAVLDRDPADAQAALLLARCEKQSGPRPGDSQTEGLERLKINYEESAYWQLKAVLQPEKP